MIRALTIEDKEAVLAFLYHEPEINLYIIGDIYNGAFENDYQQLYAEFRDDKFFAVLSRNMSTLTYYAIENDFNEEWLKIFSKFDWIFISSKEKLMEPIKKHFPKMREDKMDFMKSTTFKRDESIDYSGIRILETKQDASMVFDLLKTIPELYTVHAKGKAEAIQYFLHNSGENGTTVFIEKDNQVVATASAVYESKKSAMIVAVASHGDYRGHGYGKTVMHYLMDLYINHKEKTLCLYYDDPIAEKLYKKLNFVDIDRWSMLVPDNESTQY